jgi:dTMP kinase
MIPRFITLEGMDGAGKGTHQLWIETWLTERSIPYISTREPGGTPLAERIRDLVLHSTDVITYDTECLLMFAARTAHVHTVILPALARGCTVLCDRFIDSTYAYQGGGRGIPFEKIDALANWCSIPKPDLCFLFDVDPSTARERIDIRSHDISLDRFESEQDVFHERVRDAFLRRAYENNYIQKVDAQRSIVDIQQELDGHLSSLFLA